MRKIFYCIWNAFLILALSVSLSCVTVSCGDDDPDEPTLPAPETPAPENPEQPDVPETPDEPDEPETPTIQDPPEGDSTKYFTPTKEDFLGAWKAYWAKVETYKCKGGKWSLSETEIYTSENIGYLQNWAKIIGFIDDNLNREILVWDYAASHLSTILEAIENRDSWISRYDIGLTDGKITGGDNYDWRWYPKESSDMSMIVLFKNSKVQHRWKITQFDGETFTSSPPFYDDFPSNKDGDMATFYTYKYKRFTNTQ